MTDFVIITYVNILHIYIVSKIDHQQLVFRICFSVNENRASA